MATATSVPPDEVAPGTVSGMAECVIKLIDGDIITVEGELQHVIDELHKVASRREHIFANLRDEAGEAIAVRPEAVVYVRPVS
jgi:hypothetical protein